MSDNEFYGKYRGVVTTNADQLNLGRIRALVPEVLGSRESGWALPCLPFGQFAVPPKDALVWIEFEKGNPEFPVWTGCFWNTEKEMPALPASYKGDPGSVILIRTAGGHSILLDDAQSGGGITLQTSGGQKIVINSQSIEIDNGNGATIKLSGRSVNLNGQALEVT